MTFGHHDPSTHEATFGHDDAYNEGLVVGHIWGTANWTAIALWGAPALASGAASAGTAAPQLVLVGGGTIAAAPAISLVDVLAGLGLAVFATSQGGGPVENQTVSELEDSRDTLSIKIFEHVDKRNTFARDPIGNSGRRWLETATRDNPTEEVLLERALGRVGALNDQIRKQVGELLKVLTELIKRNSGS